MNEGFFTSSQIKTFAKKIKLPPRPHVEFTKVEGATPKSKAVAEPKTPQMTMDIECYINYFLVKFKRLSDGEMFEYEQTPDSPLAVDSIRILLKKYEIITFKGNTYDLPMLKYALTGVSCKQLKEASDDLIQTGIQTWQFERKHDLPKMKIKHIDLIEIPKGILSLKIYGGRLHAPKLQDLPIQPNAVLSDSDMDDILEYCGNDLDLTHIVYNDLSPQIEIRRVMSDKYGVDLKSKSDAQIAEAVIRAEIEKLTGKEVPEAPRSKRDFYYSAPEFIKFESHKLNQLLDIYNNYPLTIAASGHPQEPEKLSECKKFKFGHSTYTVGLGGLHSKEKCAFHVADDRYSIWDWDVTSYYPMIIIICGLFPEHLGKHFKSVYSMLVTERIAAKKAGNKELAEVLKIVINGSFGKFGSQFSALYSPNLLAQTTITGQLSLLMLIEMMEKKGIEVISGNTDGIVLKCPRSKEQMMKFIIKRWETQTGFTMEDTEYAGIWSRDINNYVAIKPDGYVKTKGIFAPAAIDQSPNNDICAMAMIEYLKYGTPFEQTIRSCRDITKFIALRSVSGGAVKDGKYLGKAIRWYMGVNEKGSIFDQKNNVQVALTEGAVPIMDLRIPFPNDIDYDWYEQKTKEIFQ